MKMEMTRPATRIELAERVDELQEKLDKKDKEIENWKKIAEKLAEEMALHGLCSGVEESDKCYANEIQCKQCIIDWARKEVEKDGI